jgi:sugar/nucleoside kinase (ribokinase family)
MRVLRIDERSPYQQLVGVGGIGTGIFFALDGDHTLGREESRPGQLLDVRDYCKLHIVIHYVARLLGASQSGLPFHVLPIGNVGDDAPGHFVLQEMSKAGIDTRQVRRIASKPTLFSVCFQYPNGEGGNITACNSAAAALAGNELDEVAPLLAVQGKRTITLAAPEVPIEARRRLLELATAAGAFRAASFVSAEILAMRDSGMFELMDLVSLNESEAAELVGCRFTPEEPRPFADACLKFLGTEYPKLQMIVSAGESGAYAFAGGFCNYCPAPQVEVASTAGAGDSLLGGVLAALAAGIPLLRQGSSLEKITDGVVETALEFGVLLASYKCKSPHTIHPKASLDTLVEFARHLKLTFSPRIEQLFTERAPVGG